MPCSEWESRPIPEEPEVRFYFNHLHRHWFYPGETDADRAHPTQVLEPSAYWSLHWIPKKKNKKKLKPKKALDAAWNAVSDVECQMCTATAFGAIIRHRILSRCWLATVPVRQLTTDYLHLLCVCYSVIVYVFVPALPVLIQCHADVWSEWGW